MSEPWFDPGIFAAVYGALIGGVGGTVLGAAGGVGGSLARKGQQRPWVSFSLKAVFIYGIASIVCGVVALGFGQPWGIWSSLIFFGAGASYFARGVDRAVRKIYAESPKPPKLVLPDSIGES